LNVEVSETGEFRKVTVTFTPVEPDEADEPDFLEREY
jgi:hypothetical protein